MLLHEAVGEHRFARVGVPNDQHTWHTVGLGVGEHMLELIQDLFRTGIANPAWTANALDALVHREREGSVRLLSEVGHPVSHGVPQSPQRVGYRLQARPDHRSAT